MHPSPHSNFIEEFSRYITSGEPLALAPYLANDANPDFLKIYRNGAIKACLDALTANFPTLNQYLGKDLFKELGRQYVSYQWPQDSRLSTYGAGLAEFIKTVANQYAEYSEDIAKLDRAWLDALFSGDEPPLSSAEVVDIVGQDNGNGQRLVRLASSVRLVRLDFDCLPLWIGMKFAPENQPEEQSSKFIMMWRLDQKVHYRQLDEFEAGFIDAIAESGSIVTAAETAIAIDPGKDISTLFAGLLSAGVLAKTDNK